MSSVLFLPESAVFAGLDTLLPLDVNGLLAVNAVINILALYGALRLVAGRRRKGAAPVAWALVGLVTFGVLAMTDVSGSRDALDLASLVLTTTYYSATVVAVVLSVGLVRRLVDRDRFGGALLVVLGATAAIATLSNPLCAVWATVPITLVLALMLPRAPHRIRPTMILVALITGTASASWVAFRFGHGSATPEPTTSSPNSGRSRWGITEPSSPRARGRQPG